MTNSIAKRILRLDLPVERSLQEVHRPVAEVVDRPDATDERDQVLDQVVDDRDQRRRDRRGSREPKRQGECEFVGAHSTWGDRNGLDEVADDDREDDDAEGNRDLEHQDDRVADQHVDEPYQER